MAEHLNLVSIGVADLIRSREFHVTGPGWEVAHSPGFAIDADGRPSIGEVAS